MSAAFIAEAHCVILAFQITSLIAILAVRLIFGAAIDITITQP